MAEVNDGDILRIGATWSFGGAYEVTNVFHAKVVSGGNLPYVTASLDVQQYMNDIYVQVEPKMSDEMVTDFITLSNPTQATTFGAIAWAAELVGDKVQDATALGVCLFGWARTLTPRVQIRKYWGVFTEDDMTDALWVAAARTAADLAMAVHIQEFLGNQGMTLQGVAYNRTLQTSAMPISSTTSAEPAYQRRRKRGRGS